MTELDLSVQETTLDMDGVFDISALDRALVIVDLNGFQLAGGPILDSAFPLDKARVKRWITSIDKTVTTCLTKLDKKVNGIKYVFHDDNIPNEAAPSLGPFTTFEFFKDRLDSLDLIEEHKSDQGRTIIALVTDYRVQHSNDFWRTIKANKLPHTAIRIRYPLTEHQILGDNSNLDKIYCCPPNVSVFEPGLNPTVQPSVAAQVPKPDPLGPAQDHENAARQILQRGGKEGRVAGFVTFIEAATKAYEAI